MRFAYRVEHFLIVVPTNPMLNYHAIRRHAVDDLDDFRGSADRLGAHRCSLRRLTVESHSTTACYRTIRAGRHPPSYLSSLPVQPRADDSAPESPREPPVQSSLVSLWWCAARPAYPSWARAAGLYPGAWAWSWRLDLNSVSHFRPSSPRLRRRSSARAPKPALVGAACTSLSCLRASLAPSESPLSVFP